MPVTLHWFLTTAGDGRHIVGSFHGAAGRAVSGGFREPDIDYLAQIARAADHLGFTGALTPTGTWCEDAWLTTAALIRDTRRLKFLVAFRPGLISPTLAAQMATTYQRISRGRLLLNVVTGGDAVEMQRQVAAAKGKLGLEDALTALQSDTEAYNGHFEKARELTRLAEDTARRRGDPETAASYRAEAAMREAEVGHGALARQDVAAALTMSANRNVRMWA